MLSEKNRRILKTGHPVRVLIVEDSVDDAELMVRHLRKGGFKPKSKRVESANTLASALHNHSWDIILCDHNMPGFDSLEALEIVNKSTDFSEIPFLIISDAIPGDVISALKKKGIQASLSKQKMDQLVPAVVKELQISMSNKQDQNSEFSSKNGTSQTPSKKSSISLFEAANQSDETQEDTPSHAGNGSTHKHTGSPRVAARSKTF